jgi:hypothetical protein
VFDLPYIATHPLLARIVWRCAELRAQAKALPEGRADRKSIERRISRLEKYGLPRPDASEQQVTPIMDESGRVVAKRSSLRRRFRATRRGRPEEYSIRTRAALEEKLAEPQMTWKQLAEKYKFRDVELLRRLVRYLKDALRLEGISLPTPSECLEARQLERTFFRGRGEE